MEYLQQFFLCLFFSSLSFSKSACDFFKNSILRITDVFNLIIHESKINDKLIMN